MAYDATEVLKAIEAEPYLKEIYDDIRIEVETDEEALKELYYCWMDYDEMIPESKPRIKIPPDDEITLELKRLINLHGWKRFMKSFAKLGEIREAEAELMGLVDHVEKWKLITRRFKEVSRKAVHSN